VAVSELCALPIVVGQRRIACGPTDPPDPSKAAIIPPDAATITLAVSSTMTLRQGGCRNGRRQHQTHDDGPKKMSSITRVFHK